MDNILLRALGDIKFISLRIDIHFPAPVSFDIFLGKLFRGGIKKSLYERHCIYRELPNCRKCINGGKCTFYHLMGREGIKNYFIRLPRGINRDIALKQEAVFYISVFGSNALTDSLEYMRALYDFSVYGIQFHRHFFQFQVRDIRDEFSGNPLSPQKPRGGISPVLLSICDILPETSPVSECVLTAESPILIEEDGKPLKPRGINIQIIYNRLILRMQSIRVTLYKKEGIPIEEFKHLTHLPKIKSELLGNIPYQSKHLTRRKKTRFKYTGGLLSMDIRGELEMFMPLLMWGEFFGVGRQQSIGFGYYRLYEPS